MKIIGLNTFLESGKLVVGAHIEVDTQDVLLGVAQVVNAINGASGAKALPEVGTEIMDRIITPATATPAPATRRPRSAPAAETVAQPPVVEQPVAGERRRRTAAPATTETPPAAPAGPRVVTDADMSKAASNAAVTLTPPVVTSILGFYDAQTTGDVKPHAREAFIATVNQAIQAHAIVGAIVGAVAADVETKRAEDSSIDAAAYFLSELQEEIKLAEAEKAAAK